MSLCSWQAVNCKFIGAQSLPSAYRACQARLQARQLLFCPVCAVKSTWYLPTRAQCAAPVSILLLPSAMPAAELQLLSVEERAEALQASGLNATQVEDVETMLSGGCCVGFREGSWGNEEGGAQSKRPWRRRAERRKRERL